MLTQEDLDQIIMALKAEGVDFTALETVASLLGVNSLPAIVDGKLVDVPISLLAKPAEDAAKECKAVKELAESSIKKAQTDASTGIAKVKSDASASIKKVETDASTSISSVEAKAKGDIEKLATESKALLDTAAGAATTAAAGATKAGKGADEARKSLEEMLPSLVLNDGGEMNALATIIATLIYRIDALQNLVADLLAGRATFRKLSVDDLQCNIRNNIVEFGKGAPAEAPYDQGRLYIDVENGVLYKSIHNESPSGWTNK